MEEKRNKDVMDKLVTQETDADELENNRIRLF